MAVAVADSTVQAANAPASPWVVNYPGTTVSGDLIVVIIDRSDATAARQFNTPTGWSAIDNQLANGNVVRLQSFWKFSAGESSESFAYSVSNPNGAIAGVYRITGAAASSPIDSHGTNSVTSGNPYTANAITIIGTGVLLLSAFARSGAAGNTWSPPAGQTEIGENGAGITQPTSFEATYENALLNAGTTGSRTATASAGTNTGGASAMIGIAPQPDIPKTMELDNPTRLLPRLDLRNWAQNTTAYIETSLAAYTWPVMRDPARERHLAASNAASWVWQNRAGFEALPAGQQLVVMRVPSVQRITTDWQQPAIMDQPLPAGQQLVVMRLPATYRPVTHWQQQTAHLTEEAPAPIPVYEWWVPKAYLYPRDLRSWHTFFERVGIIDGIVQSASLDELIVLMAGDMLGVALRSDYAPILLQEASVLISTLVQASKDTQLIREIELE